MKVALRPLREADAETSISWRQDPEIWRYTLAAGRSPPCIAQEREWIKQVVSDPSSRRFAVLVDDRYVGNLYFTDITGGRAEFHIVIGDKSYWGRGVASEATRQALQLAVSTLELKSLHLTVHQDNEAAIRMYGRFGFHAAGDEGDFVRMEKRLSKAEPQQPGT